MDIAFGWQMLWGRGWLMRSTSLQKASTYQLLCCASKQFWVAYSFKNARRVAPLVHPTCQGEARWAVFFLCWNHLASRSREIPSTGWSRKCCWRTGFSIFRFQTSSAFKLVQNSKFILSQQERVGETFATLDSCAQSFKHTSWYCSAALKKIFQVQPQMEAVKWDGPFFVVVYQGILQIAYLEAAESDSSLYVLMFFPMFLEHYAQGFLSIFIWIEDVFKFLISWYPPSVQPPIQKSTSPSFSRLCWQGLLSMAAKEFNHHSHCLKCTANTWFPDLEIGGWVPRNLSSFHISVTSLFEVLDFLFCPQLRILLAADSPSSMSILTRHVAWLPAAYPFLFPRESSSLPSHDRVSARIFSGADKRQIRSWRSREDQALEWQQKKLDIPWINLILEDRTLWHLPNSSALSSRRYAFLCRYQEGCRCAEEPWGQIFNSGFVLISFVFTFSFRKEKGLPAPAKKGSGLTDIAFEIKRHGIETKKSAPVAKERVVELMVRKMKMTRTTNGQTCSQNVILYCHQLSSAFHFWISDTCHVSFVQNLRRSTSKSRSDRKMMQPRWRRLMDPWDLFALRRWF